MSRPVPNISTEHRCPICRAELIDMLLHAPLACERLLETLLDRLEDRA